MTNRFKYIILAVCATALLFVGGCTPEGYVADKVSVMGVEIGGLSYDDAVKELNNIVLDTGKEAVIELDGERIYLSAEKLGATYNVEKTASEVVEKSKGVFSGWFKKDYDMAVDINPEKLSAALSEIEVQGEATRAVVVDEGIKIKNAYPSKSVDRETFVKKLVEYFGTNELEEIKLDYKITSIDGSSNSEILSALKNEYKEPEYIRNSDGTISVTESSQGVVFDMDEALSVMNSHKQEGEEFIISCEVKKPKYTKEELEEALFRDELASYSSSFATSSANRASNVNLAASSIDEIILLPGEEFSFNDALGERTVERGYKSAGAYVAGKTVDQVGGGICQVSSTLYNTVLLSNLEITERRSHQMTVSYVPVGRDATVNWGTTDFRFKNNTEYPVKIVGKTEGRKLIVSMLGTLTDPTREVKIETSTVSVIPPVEEIVEDAEKEVGFTETDKGSNGYVVDAVRVVYSEGKEISREKLTRSRYNPTKTVITIGTKVVEQPTGEAPVVEENNEMPAWLIPRENTSDTGL